MSWTCRKSLCHSQTLAKKGKRNVPTSPSEYLERVLQTEYTPEGSMWRVMSGGPDWSHKPWPWAALGRKGVGGERHMPRRIFYCQNLMVDIWKSTVFIPNIREKFLWIFFPVAEGVNNIFLLRGEYILKRQFLILIQVC